MIQLREIHKTCESHPAQWEGTTTDERRIYIRYRWGFLQASIGPVGEGNILSAVQGKSIFEKDFNDEYHGEMSEETLQEELKGVVTFP